MNEKQTFNPATDFGSRTAMITQIVGDISATAGAASYSFASSSTVLLADVSPMKIQPQVTAQPLIPPFGEASLPSSLPAAIVDLGDVVAVLESLAEPGTIDLEELGRRLDLR
jgi:hypothetical protein